MKNDAVAEHRQKEYADSRKKARPYDISLDDSVLVKQYIENQIIYTFLPSSQYCHGMVQKQQQRMILAASLAMSAFSIGFMDKRILMSRELW